MSSTSPVLEIANPIYKQIIPAVLASKYQQQIAKDIQFYVNKDDSLNMSALLQEFTQFYGENSEAWLQGLLYREAGPHILMLTFMQRLINGKGEIIRDYALGTKRVDLYIKWKQQKFVLELKIKRGEITRERGAEQIACYMDKTGAEGHLIVFDRNNKKSSDEKISNEIIDVNCRDLKAARFLFHREANAISPQAFFRLILKDGDSRHPNIDCCI